MKLILRTLLAATLLSPLSLVAQKDVPKTSDLPASAEIDYQRAFSIFANAQSEAQSAQSDLVSAQGKFDRVKVSYSASRETFLSKAREIAKANKCDDITVSDGKPVCVKNPTAEPAKK